MIDAVLLICLCILWPVSGWLFMFRTERGYQISTSPDDLLIMFVVGALFGPWLWLVCWFLEFLAVLGEWGVRL